jgi:hypothetical protein
VIGSEIIQATASCICLDSMIGGSANQLHMQPTVTATPVSAAFPVPISHLRIASQAATLFHVTGVPAGYGPVLPIAGNNKSCVA